MTVSIVNNGSVVWCLTGEAWQSYKKNQAVRQYADDFIELLTSECTDLIGDIARTSVAEARYNRRQILPPTRDVVKLKVYWERELCKTFLQSPSANNFYQLARVVLYRLIAFNNQQPEELAKLLVGICLLPGTLFLYFWTNASQSLRQWNIKVNIGEIGAKWPMC